MSKKSRKRNKKILAAIGLGLGAAAMASKKRNASIADNEANESGFAASTKKPSIRDVSGDKKSTAVKDKGPVKTSTTIMDSKPAKAKKNELSKRIQKSTNKVYTIKGAKEGNPAKVGNPKSLVIGDDGSYSKGDRTFPNKMSYMNRDQKPAMLGLKSGGRVKGCGKALRGFGKAMKGKR